MAKRKRPVPVPATAAATAVRFDGGAVKIEFVMQPQEAAQLVQQILTSLGIAAETLGRSP